MDLLTRYELATEMHHLVGNFASAVPGSEQLILNELRATIRRAEHKLSRPSVIDPLVNPFDDDDL